MADQQPELYAQSFDPDDALRRLIESCSRAVVLRPTRPTTGARVRYSRRNPEPSVTCLQVLQALEAARRPYRMVVSSGSLAALKAAVMAGLGVSALARYVMPDGLIRVTGPPFPKLQKPGQDPNRECGNSLRGRDEPMGLEASFELKPAQ